MAGILHSFEPDHVTAVSALASERAVTQEKVSVKTVLQASQWAIGHSVTILLFGGIALAFKSSLSLFIKDISFCCLLYTSPSPRDRG